MEIGRMCRPLKQTQNQFSNILGSDLPSYLLTSVKPTQYEILSYDRKNSAKQRKRLYERNCSNAPQFRKRAN